MDMYPLLAGSGMVMALWLVQVVGNGIETIIGWTTREDQMTSKQRFLAIVLIVVMVIAFMAYREHQSRQLIGRDSCERVYGYGNCVQRDDRWVPEGRVRFTP